MDTNINLNLYEDGSLPMLDIGQSLNHIEENEKNNFLNLCYKKLSYGGKLILQGVHLDSFCKEYLFSQQVNINPILRLNSVTSLNDIQLILQQHNMKITHTKITNGLYTIEAIK